MTQHDTYIGRRPVLKGAATSLAALGGLAGFANPVAAGGGKGKRESLVDGPAEFQLFWSGADGDPTDADNLDDFGYPDLPTDIPFDGSGKNSPFVAGEDGVGGLFDASDIEMTPNGKTLHHTLRFFQGFLIEGDRGKPYVLVNQGLEPVDSGIPPLTHAFRFVAKGQHINFDAVGQQELLANLGVLDPEQVQGFPTPLFNLTGKTLRAVGTEVVFVAPTPEGEPSRQAPFSATRVDFYERAKGKPSFIQSLLYIIYPDFDPDSSGGTGPLNFQPMPPVIHGVGQDLITGGVRNLGGR